MTLPMCPALLHLNLAWCSQLAGHFMYFLKPGTLQPQWFSSPQDVPRVRLWSLTVLDLSWTSACDEDMLAVAETCPQLRALALVACAAVTDDGACRVVSRCTQLRALDLSSCRGVGDATLRALAGLCTQLEQLTLAGTGAVDPSATPVSPSHRHSPYAPRSPAADVSRKYSAKVHAATPTRSRVTDDGVLCLAAAPCPLRALVLRGTSVSDDSVTAVLECHGSTLTRLDVSYTRVGDKTPDAVWRFATRLTDLTIHTRHQQDDAEFHSAMARRGHMVPSFAGAQPLPDRPRVVPGVSFSAVHNLMRRLTAAGPGRQHLRLHSAAPRWASAVASRDPRVDLGVDVGVDAGVDTDAQQLDVLDVFLRRHLRDVADVPPMHTTKKKK